MFTPVSMFRPGMLIVGLLLGACANPAVERAIVAQSALVGLPEQALLSCAGVPNRTAAEGDVEYFTYARRGLSAPASPSVGIGVGGGSSSGVGVGIGFGLPIFSSGRTGGDCEATFILRNGVVEQLRYRTGRGGGAAAQCAPIVQNCLDPVSR